MGREVSLAVPSGSQGDIQPFRRGPDRLSGAFGCLFVQNGKVQSPLVGARASVGVALLC